jgi:hypothetical protein
MDDLDAFVFTYPVWSIGLMGVAIPAGIYHKDEPDGNKIILLFMDDDSVWTFIEKHPLPNHSPIQLDRAEDVYGLLAEFRSIGGTRVRIDPNPTTDRTRWQFPINSVIVRLAREIHPHPDERSY